MDKRNADMRKLSHHVVAITSTMDKRANWIATIIYADELAPVIQFDLR